MAFRFENRQKFLVLSKYYGARGIISPDISCKVKFNIWQNLYQKRCTLFMALIDGVTSKVVVAVRDEQNTSELGDPDWDEIIEKMIDKLPTDVSELQVNFTPAMKKYIEDVVEKEAQVQEEKAWMDVPKRDEKHGR